MFKLFPRKENTERKLLEITAAALNASRVELDNLHDTLIELDMHSKHNSDIDPYFSHAYEMIDFRNGELRKAESWKTYNA